MSGRFLNEGQKRKRYRNRQWAVLSVLSRGIVGLLLVGILLLNLFTHVFQLVRYTGNGMEPNLRSGQTLLLRKTQDVEEGDIIAFYYNNQILVRRVICLGGKQIAVDKDGTVRINSQTVQEDYLEKKSIGQCNITFPNHVQNGHVFVMGDNREIAMDSRLKEIGPVPQARIIGKVLLAF